MDRIERTAIAIAEARARESERPDRLFADPYAARFVQAAGATGAWDDAARQGWERFAVIRTRFLDDLLAGASLPQAVLLGAGLDARAFRLDWPVGARVFELDLPDVLAFKERVLGGAGARCERVAVACDLSTDWPPVLAAAGHDPAQPTVWIVEGLLMYLTPEEGSTLLARAAALSPAGSRLGLTLPDVRGNAEDGGLFRSTQPEDTVAWLAALGWRATVFNSAERAASYGRSEWTEPARDGLVDAVRTLDP